jgi:tungstate transport system substrate-binding protein
MMLKNNFLTAVIALVLGLVGSFAQAADQMKLAVTTSFHNSGLADVLLPEIKQDLDIEVQLIVVGTGQALKLGRAGDVDAILVHSKAAEEKFVSEGYGTHRRKIMYNDFTLIGGKADPAKISEAKTASDALAQIAKSNSIFVSRGDDSGTHRKELSLWKKAELNAENFDAKWYRAVGSGMGATLNVAAGLEGYVFSDRASWLNFKNKADMAILFSGDPVLFNQYGYLPVDPKRHPHAKNELANKLEAWLVSDKGQKMIADYKLAGELLFTPNAQ